MKTASIKILTSDALYWAQEVEDKSLLKSITKSDDGCFERSPKWTTVTLKGMCANDVAMILRDVCQLEKETVHPLKKSAFSRVFEALHCAYVSMVNP